MFFESAYLDIGRIAPSHSCTVANFAESVLVIPGVNFLWEFSTKSKTLVESDVTKRIVLRLQN